MILYGIVVVNVNTAYRVYSAEYPEVSATGPSPSPSAAATPSRAPSASSSPSHGASPTPSPSGSPSPPPYVDPYACSRANTCNGHGECAGGSSTATTCVCDVGYAASDCSACAPLFTYAATSTGSFTCSLSDVTLQDCGDGCALAVTVPVQASLTSVTDQATIDQVMQSVIAALALPSTFQIPARELLAAGLNGAAASSIKLTITAVAGTSITTSSALQSCIASLQSQLANPASPLMSGAAGPYLQGSGTITAAVRLVSSSLTGSGAVSPFFPYSADLALRSKIPLTLRWRVDATTARRRLVQQPLTQQQQQDGGGSTRLRRAEESHHHESDGDGDSDGGGGDGGYGGSAGGGLDPGTSGGTDTGTGGGGSGSTGTTTAGGGSGGTGGAASGVSGTTAISAGVDMWLTGELRFPYSSWFGVGFGGSPSMNPSDAIACEPGFDGSTVNSYLLNGYTGATCPAFPSGSSLVDGTLSFVVPDPIGTGYICRFRRKVAGTAAIVLSSMAGGGSITPKDLSGGEVYLISAHGGAGKLTMGSHTTEQSGALIVDFVAGTSRSVRPTASSVLFVLHAVLGALAVAVLLPVGSFIARYYRHLGSKTPHNDGSLSVWYRYHWILSAVGLCMVAVAFILGSMGTFAAYEPVTAIKALATPHGILSLVTCFIAVLMGATSNNAVRPKWKVSAAEGEPYDSDAEAAGTPSKGRTAAAQVPPGRWVVWSVAHALIGVLLLLTGLATCFTGILDAGSSPIRGMTPLISRGAVYACLAVLSAAVLVLVLAMAGHEVSRKCGSGSSNRVGTEGGGGSKRPRLAGGGRSPVIPRGGGAGVVTLAQQHPHTGPRVTSSAAGGAGVVPCSVATANPAHGTSNSHSRSREVGLPVHMHSSQQGGAVIYASASGYECGTPGAYNASAPMPSPTSSTPLTAGQGGLGTGSSGGSIEGPSVRLPMPLPVPAAASTAIMRQRSR